METDIPIRKAQQHTPRNNFNAAYFYFGAQRDSCSADWATLRWYKLAWDPTGAESGRKVVARRYSSTGCRKGPGWLEKPPHTEWLGGLKERNRSKGGSFGRWWLFHITGPPTLLEYSNPKRECRNSWQIHPSIPQRSVRKGKRSDMRWKIWWSKHSKPSLGYVSLPNDPSWVLSVYKNAMK